MLILVIAVFICVLLPAYAVYVAWSARNGGRLAWLMKVAAAIGYLGFLSLIARWDFLSVYLLWGWWALLAIVVVIGLFAMRDRRWIENEKRSALWSAAIEPVIGVALLGYAATGLLHPPATEMSWPLGDGRFYVAHGGNNAMLNYHNTHTAQRFALDIMKLDELGRRAEGFEPTALDDYVIYGQPVLSPCDGTVAARTDGIADNVIGETNVDAPAGNHVVLTCGDVNVEIAHFRPGTLKVAEGDAVTAGQPLGEVGNSGNSSEPHLHMHAVGAGAAPGKGEGVPLRFGGVFPVRNTIMER